MTRALQTAAVLIMVAGPTDLVAQNRNGTRPILARTAEIALAKSAAPAAVSTDARVWIWTGKQYAVADSGRTVVNCYVGRPFDSASEPHCFDEEGARTIMPILMRRVELYVQGKSEKDVEAEIANDLLAGKLRLPQRPAVTYMMSAAQQLISQGNAIGAWQPHLMIYYPYMTSTQIGLPGFVPDLGFVENPGQALSAMIIPLKTFAPAPK